jgi:hypothetical protein
MNQGRLLESGRPDDLYTRPQKRFVATFLGAANLLLGYRTARGVRFSSHVASGEAVPREVVAVLRPEEVELGSSEPAVRSNFVGYGDVEEVLFSGAVERLRVRMAGDGPVPVAPGREGSPDSGSLLEVSRTLPEQRDFPVATGQRVAVGARRVHVLPTPISSFTAVGATEAAVRALHDSPLLSTLGTRMHTRVAMQVGIEGLAPPGMPAVATGPGCAQAAEWQLQHGAVQLLCVPPNAPLPTRMVIHALDADARRATVPVAASLLRHVAAEAVYLGIHPAASSETDRAGCMRELLDTRSAALAEHGLDMRTELRFGEIGGELQHELGLHENAMLVLGTSDPGRIDWRWLGGLLDGQPERPVLIVNAARAEQWAER